MAENDAGESGDIVTRAAAEGCAESRLVMSRRSMLGITAGLYSWAFMPRFASAREAAGDDPRLLIVVLRGGMDGLSVVVPNGDPQYVPLRGQIAVPAESTIRLNSFFGLHPALANFGRMYAQQDAAIVHATCVPLQNRSHFDTQDNLENGLPGAALHSTGWLNRLLAGLPQGDPIATSGAVQIGPAPLIMRGSAPVLGWAPNTFGHLDSVTEYLIRTNYRENDPQLYEVLESGLKTSRLAEKVQRDDSDVSVLRRSFRGAARLLAWDEGPRIAALSVNGWDTHSDQGAADGKLARSLADLDVALADYKAEAGETWARTVVVLATEFGRTARTNGTRGTDHGVGTVTLLAGGSVNGGRVFGDWPGLAENQLLDRSDLRPTTDLRSVFKGVLHDHLGVPATLLDTDVFPESAPVGKMANLVMSPSAKSRAAIDDAVNYSTFPPREPGIAQYRRETSASGPAPAMKDMESGPRMEP